MGPYEANHLRQHGGGTSHFADDARHRGLFAVPSAAGELAAEMVQVDAGETRQKAPDVVTATLFSVRHDVDAGIFLVRQCETHSVVVSLRELVTREQPR